MHQVGNPIEFQYGTFGGGASGAEVRDLDPGLVVQMGGLLHPFVGLGNWYEIGGTSII